MHQVASLWGRTGECTQRHMEEHEVGKRAGVVGAA